MHSEVNTRDIQPSTKVGRLVLTALFLSGMTAIAYEIIWQRLLVRTTGATLPAVSQIFCVFIAGLWAGSLLSIPILRKSTTPLRTYAFLELAIAIFAILIPVFFGEQLSAEFLHGTHVLVQLFTSKSDNLDLMSAVVQNILYFVILFVPAVLMGVTFNCVTKYLDDSRSRLLSHPHPHPHPHPCLHPPLPVLAFHLVMPLIFWRHVWLRAYQLLANSSSWIINFKHGARARQSRRFFSASLGVTVEPTAW